MVTMPGARQFCAMKPIFSSDKQMTSSPPTAAAASSSFAAISSAEACCQLQPGICSSCSCIFISNNHVTLLRTVGCRKTLPDHSERFTDVSLWIKTISVPKRSDKYYNTRSTTLKILKQSIGPKQCIKKLTCSQLSLPHGTNRQIKEKKRTKINREAL